MAREANDMPKSRHVLRVRVYFEDTDTGGIVYYANYLKFAERARTEWLRELGADHSGLMATEGVMMTVKRCEAEFVAPARLDDLLEVQTAVEELGGASMWLDQRVTRGGDPIANLRVRLACVNRELKPAKLPARLKALLAPYARHSKAVG
jgi:acyl-CoA thioester hydrolase